MDSKSRSNFEKQRRLCCFGRGGDLVKEHRFTFQIELIKKVQDCLFSCALVRASRWKNDNCYIVNYTGAMLDVGALVCWSEMENDPDQCCFRTAFMFEIIRFLAQALGQSVHGYPSVSTSTVDYAGAEVLANLAFRSSVQLFSQ